MSSLYVSTTFTRPSPGTFLYPSLDVDLATSQLWSSISAKIRCLYLTFDLLYFMLYYTRRHSTLLISGSTFPIANGTLRF